MKKTISMLLILIAFLCTTCICFGQEKTFWASLDSPRDGDTFSLNIPSIIKGWAYYPAGMERIEILVNGKRIGTAKYGTERGDVKKAYPDLAGIEKSGFEYKMKAGDLSVGETTITVLAVSKKGESQKIGSSKVKVVEKGNASFGCIDSPLENYTVSSSQEFMGVVGWIIDPDVGVKEVEIYLDNKLLGKAEYGIGRGDVKAAHSALPEKFTLKSGFSYRLDLDPLEEGPHTVMIKEISNDGTNKSMGTRNFVLEKDRTGTILIIIVVVIFLGGWLFFRKRARARKAAAKK